MPMGAIDSRGCGCLEFGRRMPVEGLAYIRIGCETLCIMPPLPALEVTRNLLNDGRASKMGATTEVLTTLL